MIRPAAALTTLLLIATPVLADDDDFIGLYQGINLGTGSLDTVSITPGGDGHFAVAEHASAFGACEGVDTRATSVALGTLDGGILKRTRGKATCVATATSVDLRDGEYVLSDDESLLTLRVPDHDNVTYHRISDD